MKTFKGYASSTQEQEEKRQTPPAYTDEDAVARLTRQVAQAYDGKPSVEMLRSILAQAEESKRNGSLTNADIDAFYEQFSPLIDERQRKMLKSVVEKLKRI